MAACLIVKVNVTDWEQYREYMKASPGVVAQFGGRFIVRGGERVTLEGPEDTDRIVILEFESVEQVKAFYYSPEYQEAKKLREGAAEASFIAVEGI